jgi:GcrA cell cycle regulator
MPNNNPLGGTWWSDDHCADLATLLASGMIYREIARTINEKFGTNFSKNSIVGKVQRLNLTPPKKEKRPPYVRKPKIKSSQRTRRVYREVMRIVSANISGGMRIVRAVETDQPALRCVEVEPRHLSLIDLEPGDCRYPYGDGPMTFCGHPKQDGSSYCFHHFHLCRQEPRPLTDKRYSRAAA